MSNKLIIDTKWALNQTNYYNPNVFPVLILHDWHVVDKLQYEQILFDYLDMLLLLLNLISISYYDRHHQLWKKSGWMWFTSNQPFKIFNNPLFNYVDLCFPSCAIYININHYYFVQYTCVYSISVACIWCWLIDLLVWLHFSLSL